MAERRSGLWEATAAAKWRILVTEYVLEETVQVLSRKFNRPQLLILTTRALIHRYGEMVGTPHSRHQVPGDPNDTPILRAAVGNGADYLVTRDNELLKLGRVESLRIITLADYLDILRSHGHLDS